MLSVSAQHLLTGEELKTDEIFSLLKVAQELKQARKSANFVPYLSGKHLALLFSKPSLRTRFSFTVAMRELGGDIIESISDTRKKEEPEDQARVLSGYCHGIMLRTHADADLTRMSKVVSIPIINGLSNLHHPCQALSDLLTLQENFGEFKNLRMSYIGDGNNVLHSLLLLAPKVGVNVNYCCPKGREPNSEIVLRANQSAANYNATIEAFALPAQAVKDAHAVYTDVWASMGFEQQANDELFNGFQVNEALMQCARKEAVFMHCLPMERGKEVSETLPDSSCSVIFQQSENRLHLQKALLLGLMNK